MFTVSWGDRHYRQMLVVQQDDSSSANGFNVERVVEQMLLSLCGDTQDSLLIGGKFLVLHFISLPYCLAWKLSSLSESFHVFEININLLSSILFSMQSECVSFHFYGSNLFSFVALLNPTLLPTQVWEKLWEHKKSDAFGQRLGWLRNTFVIVFKGKWEIRYSFLDSLEWIISRAA